MFPRLAAPVVLAHGLLGFAQMAVRRLKLATYFRAIPDLLCRAGNRVVLTEVPPTASIATRAEALKRELRKHCGTEPVHVLAHSMGGLDARHMITHLGMAEQVLSLTTIGTPHRGTVLADRGLEWADQWGIFDWLKRSPLDHQAFQDLRTEACARFNAQTPDAATVRYFSVAGDKPRQQMLYALRFCHDVIAPVEGANDGLVSVRSAEWGETLTVWDCDHVNQVGWYGWRERLLGHIYDVEQGYREILQRLVKCGF